MEIRQIGNYNGDIISTVLNNRGIEDIGTFLNPSIRDYKTDVSTIRNMEIGVELFLEFLKVKARIGLVVDSDMDGITSASMIYRFIQDFTGGYEDLHYFLQDGKAHGLSKKVMKEIKEKKIEFLIISDASTNDVQQIEELYQLGIEVLVIDHHEAEEGWQENRAVLINNQLDETNKNFVGAGMVLNFLRAVAQRTNRPIASKLIDLVAVGQIADQSDISDAEIRGLVFYGLKNMNNPFLLHIMETKGIKRGECTPKDISHLVAPPMNAVIRIGEMEDREIIFRAFAGINEDEKFFVEKKKKNKSTGKFERFIVEQTLYEYAYDLAERLKGKQNRQVKKELETIKPTVKILGGIGVAFSEPTAKNLSGLIAMRLVDEHGLPFLLCRDSGEFYEGSGRGNETILKDFKKWLHSTGYFELVQGHGNAFGFKIKKENLGFVLEASKQIEIPSENVYEVDAIINEKIDHRIIHAIDSNKEIFGGKVTEPLVAFTNISVNKKLISFKGTTLSFYEDKMKFVKFGTEFEMDYLDTFEGDRVLVDFVGKLNFNEWNGQRTEQMIIKDFEIKEVPKREVTVENIVF